MLCFACLLENRDTPNKSVTFVQGTAVCPEHVTAVGNADMMSLSYKLRGLGERLRTERSTNSAKQPIQARTDRDA
jgi:hypothetical protein